ncbi:MAG: hypothetical protein ACTTKB_04600 [Treponema sp.]
MNIQEKELMAMFKPLSKETKLSIISHVRFSAIAENAIKRQLLEKYPDLKIDLEPALMEVTQPVAING